MKLAVLVLGILACVLADDLPLAEECDPEACQLPNCLCSSTNIPGGLAPRDTPQFVTVTFDDAVNVNNIITYRNLLYNRTNSNGCPAGSTFYVNHEYTNYQLVNELYNHGMEIALHSVSHQTPQTYWAEGTYEAMKEEFADQKFQMSHFANIPADSLRGVRIPFLQLGGNSTFHVMADYGLEYDSSWPTVDYSQPGMWPYSLDYASTQDCVIPPCPTASIPNVWVQPMVTWRDLNGVACSMADSCFWAPPLTDEDAWFDFIVRNFERQYLGNRAPFGFYVHEWYVASYPGVRGALIRFMDLVNNLNDVFMVTASEVLDWVKDPVPISEYREKECRAFIPTTCPAASCGPLDAQHNSLQYWMQICNVCPRVYPWLGNPLGL